MAVFCTECPSLDVSLLCKMGLLMMRPLASSSCSSQQPVSQLHPRPTLGEERSSSNLNSLASADTGDTAIPLLEQRPV